ncbi:MAG: DUF1698 domain-containing protein [Bryobacterales bacterium]|nr:DUF1698 domain-containing protein [Bryobacterales bacterium]
MNRDARKNLDWSGQLNLTGWYHSFELPDGRFTEGVQSLRYQRDRYARFPIPARLDGKRLLDIGAWDGWFSFEAEKHGAAVTAVDCIEVANFQQVRRLLNSSVDYRIHDVFDLPSLGWEPFDYVFFLGILYHLRHPLLALEIVCSLTADTAIVESLVTDAPDWEAHKDQMPTLEFYETDELGGHMDNWFGPSVTALLGMCRAAGFARVELLHTADNQAQVACYRQWLPVAEREPAPELLAAIHTRTGGINVSARRDDYIGVRFRSARAAMARPHVQFQIGPYGAHTVYLKRHNDGTWEANARVPLGLAPGWHDVRIRTESGWSNAAPLAVDLPLPETDFEITGVADGATWQPGLISSGHVALWVRGLPRNADMGNIRIAVGDEKLTIQYVQAGGPEDVRQINASCGAHIAGGAATLEVSLAGIASAARYAVTIA